MSPKKQAETYDDLNPVLSNKPREEGFQPDPPYVRPLERNVAVGPMLVSTCICPKCGELFVFGIKLHGGSAISHALPSDEDPECPRCTYADKTCPPNTAEAMREVRWRYDQHLESHGSLGGFSNTEIRARFIRASDVFWRLGPVLLRELEHVYGNQLTRSVHEIVTGTDG